MTSSAITSIKDLWWDIRPHPEYGTVEVRACDALPTLSEAMSVIALITLFLGWLDAGYRLIARYRYRVFGQYAACVIPDARWRDRFIA